MPIRTGSVLEHLCAEVDKHKGRVIRAEARVDSLRDLYRRAHWSDRRKVGLAPGQDLPGLEALACDLKAAQAALQAEETRLLQPDSFLRFG